MYSTYALVGALMASTASAFSFNFESAYSSANLDTLNSDTKTFFFFTQVGDASYTNFHLSMYDIEASKEYALEIVEGDLACDMKVKFDDLETETIFSADGSDVALRGKTMIPVSGLTGLVGKYIRVINDDGVVGCSEIKASGDDFGTDIFGADGFPGPNKIDERTNEREGGEREEAVVNEEKSSSGGWSININGGGN